MPLDPVAPFPPPTCTVPFELSAVFPPVVPTWTGLPAITSPFCVVADVPGVRLTVPTCAVPAEKPDAVLPPPTFKAGASAADRQALLDQIGATLDMTVADIHVQTLLVPASRRTQALATLARSSIVVHAERDAVFHLMSMAPDDMFYSRQWGLTVGGFANVLNRPGRPVVVAVVDSGVDAALPDLKGVVLPGVDLTGSGSTSDSEGHGTAVAGVIAAIANNGIGGAGVCAKCKILPIKVTGPNGTADTALVASGIVKAVDKGARVINVSMGAPTTLATLQQAVNYATSKGAIVLAAAGNSGVTTKFYPAAYPNVISVAGSTQRDGLLRLVEPRLVGRRRGARLQRRAADQRSVRRVLRDVIGNPARRRPRRAHPLVASARDAGGDHGGRGACREAHPREHQVRPHRRGRDARGYLAS